ncbi:MAG TPA: class I SAM-dependent methyltransferase [Candidatus Competibacter sp.]|nr:class I SAM-dependent methyltransferase [Candidatus Competibacter sp.]
MQYSYRDDLAYIHDAGFGHLAKSAALMLIEELNRAGVQGGTVVDLGCGSGITARLLHDFGYKVVGIDLSKSLVEIARNRVPEAVFRIGSFVTEDIPPCVAVTAIGEVLNYAFDEANCTAVRDNAFRRIYAALAPGGLLLFDMAGPARAPSDNPQRTFTEGSDWAVLMEAESDCTYRLLTRRITTFLKLGELYRRDSERHQLQLVDPVDVVASLQRIGFCVQTLPCYGSLVLPQGLIGFLARKPGNLDAQQTASADALTRAAEF